MNSTVVNEAIKPFQTEGVYHGKRDIHRRPFEVCPIQEFDSKEIAHVAIADLARSAMDKMTKTGPAMHGGLAKVRETARKIVAGEISEIDKYVSGLMDTERAKKRALETKDAVHSQEAMF